ncbi:hypothetical protein HYFRA_00013327 [Hymenoscyphus fraxineus]|uniref:FAD-binding PCMH-type domain-containing protein n=1 Tax=Hymenoscyphus fraxineus TaxID=746836 RepID=A0A9N9LBV6_9HELO|nr:hypothetical protein HYFRA_00013327 [Hymenoscyphus fraxineus]
MKIYTFVLILTSCLTSLTIASLLPFEEIQLQAQDLSTLSPEEASLVSFPDPSSSTNPKVRDCKVFPGDTDWPSENSWDVLNRTVGGALIRTVPLAASCYEGASYDKTQCDFITQNWQDSSIHVSHPSSVLSPLYQGNTCLPPSLLNATSCTIGGYPTYVLNTTTVSQIQAGVNFARNTGIRIVIKNTGHDFSGKSGGAGALSIWTHNLNAIEYIPEYEDDELGYNGPAFKGGSGVLARDLYQAADAQGMIVVGGEGQDVGVLGGYVLGGGHSPLSSIYGLASDQVLSMSIVLANGSFITTSSTSNPELFWALRGGGGSTFGVVTSVTVRAYPTLPTTTARFSFTAHTMENFMKGVKAYWDLFIALADAGTYSYFFIIPGTIPTFIMLGFVAPNQTTTQVQSLLQPWFSILRSHNTTFLQPPNITTYTSTARALLSTFPTEPLQPDGLIGSRLFPRSALTPSSPLANRTWEAWSESINKGVIIGFNFRAPNIHNLTTSVLPAWRESVFHCIQGSAPWVPGREKEIREEFDGRMERWKAVLGDEVTGSYLGESSPEEVGWQESFWGSNYGRLVGVKKEVDPGDVFWALEAVGSEGWSVKTGAVIPDGDGRLCRV